VATSIQISEKLQRELVKRKLFGKETYEDVIWDLIENARELSEETKREIAEAREEIKKGRVHTLADVKKELGL
jgi:predicted CopG family antitoxin